MNLKELAGTVLLFLSNIVLDYEIIVLMVTKS